MTSDGGRAVLVAPARVEGWFERFAERHSGIAVMDVSLWSVVATASDGASASVAVPYGPLEDRTFPGFLAHVTRPRVVAVLLVRVGGYSMGIAEGERVVVSRTGRKPVQGRTSAGGWSQRRFARRRAGQARVALEAAADSAAEVLVPRLSDVDGVRVGGDVRALAVLRGDSRLAGLFGRAEGRVLEVGEPRRETLDAAVAQALAVEIVVREP
ncbi:acVLRF1 family peptidyl-tRNA hydrolase [Actinocrispum sp. NPDC049592]|uniref:acVLRF1 family peptidyl-tRNA hydrolase n=1 Tax=Actinocrispum sp. NPDC049592 TaxID=3154835 RepID=UPI00343FC5EB